MIPDRKYVTGNHGAAEPPKITFASDSDYGNELDRKSISGWEIRYCGVINNVGSRKQVSIAKSSAEAETAAAAEAGRNADMVYELATSMGRKLNPVIDWEYDNFAAGQAAKSKSLTKKSRHVETRELYLADRVRSGKFNPVQVRSEDQKADGHTKILPGESFFRWAHKIGVRFLGREVYDNTEEWWFRQVADGILRELGKI